MTVRLPGREQIEETYARLRPMVRRTPVVEIAGGDLGVAGRVLLKLELLQHTGSFKARGALNAVLAMPDGTAGAVAASGGNHGAAVAWACGIAGIEADVFVPSTSPMEKVRRIEEYGATAHIVDGYYAAAYEASRAWAEGRPVLPVHAYDADAIIAGAAGVGIEIGDQAPYARRVLVPCGGGGLYSGTALALRDVMPVVPVEPERCPSLVSALAAGERVDVDVSGVAADSLGAARIGERAFAVVRELAAEPLLVSDDQILAARRLLWDECRVLAEPGGVTALAALVAGKVDVRDGETVVVVISGANHPTIPADVVAPVSG
ncbi:MULTISPECIES: serine/threonine dehydratase [Mumia]|uniref:serine/threonine dehydratase n=1 Tax=Mumia TaxID=1546255 RepID=UPI001FBA040E|nr:serine/threonine dehydratase [Mumia sp. ZJ1417]